MRHFENRPAALIFFSHQVRHDHFKRRRREYLQIHSHLPSVCLLVAVFALHDGAVQKEETPMFTTMI